MIEAKNLRKDFDGFSAVYNVNFELNSGELHGLIGPNGAGKTTMFNLLTGALSPTSGTIRFKGTDITGADPTTITRMGIGRSFQIVQDFPEMTVREHFLLAIRDETRTIGSIFGTDDYEHKIRATASTVGMSDELDSPVKNLSYGDKRFLEIGMVLGLDPEVVLLDEPAAGLNESETDVLIDILEGIRAEYTILMIDHDVDLVLDLSDRITVLHQGKILSEGSPEEIRQDERIKEVYLGE
jgi:ABC-type branched-subunit amino acid transport system ATPase component